jgi:hypothetical protein
LAFITVSVRLIPRHLLPAAFRTVITIGCLGLLAATTGCISASDRYAHTQTREFKSYELSPGILKIDNEPTYKLTIQLDRPHEHIALRFKTWFAKESIFFERQYCKTWIMVQREVQDSGKR